jgi:hypothetical protein
MNKIATMDEPLIQETRKIQEKEAETTSLKTHLLLINLQKLSQLQNEMEDIMRTIHERQSTTEKLHKILQEIHKLTNKEGELHIKDNLELQNLLKEAQNLGVSIDPKKVDYTRDECLRLTSSIRMPIDALKTRNDVDFQKLSQLTNERHESYQLTKSMIEAIDNAMKIFIKNIVR